MEKLINIFFLNIEDKNGLIDEYEFNEIDELISKLLELTQPQPKYKPGNKVWLVDYNEICTAEIVEFNDGEYKLTNCKIFNSDSFTGLNDVLEEKLYPSKQALIEDQIKYWTSLKEPKEE